MNGIRRIVLDILKPHEPKITDMALKLTSLSNIDGVNITVYEIDKETENVKVTIEGNNLDFDEIQEIIESLVPLFQGVLLCFILSSISFAFALAGNVYFAR